MGAGMKGFGWVRSGIAEEGTVGGFFFFSRGERSRGPHGPSLTHLARDVVDGEVEVGAQHLERDALGLAAPAFL